jgi:ribosomal protein L37E
MAKEYRGCSRCGEQTYWIVKDDGVKCTKCETTVGGQGPFSWDYEGCSKCGTQTYWIKDAHGFEVCTGCGTAG